MALDIRLTQRLSQHLVMTPQLRQALKILQVSRIELWSLINQEIAENPMLEETAADREEEATAEPFDGDGAPAEEPVAAADDREKDGDAKDLQEIDWKDYLESYGNDLQGSISGSARDEDDDRRSTLENLPVKRQSLTDHLLWQLRMSDLQAEEEYVGALLVGNLDGDGYLRMSVEEVAFLGNTDREIVERVLVHIQHFDPSGVAAHTLSECLLIQLADLELEDSLAARIVRDHLGLLESRRLDRLAKELGVTVEEVADAARVISVLDPKPARNYGDGEVCYVTPDVYVHKVGEDYVVTLNEDGLPRLRVSSFYRRMLGSDGSPEVRGYIQEKMRAATWLIKSIHQRQRTLYMVTSSIVKFQREFLDRGVYALWPLVLKDVAQDIGMHESTVSRATAGKYVHTPQGTFELKYFFTSSLKSGYGEEVSAESVRERIKAIIEGEDAQKPLSDQHIADLLGCEGLQIARRTVTKYRKTLRILPSQQRGGYPTQGPDEPRQEAAPRSEPREVPTERNAKACGIAEEPASIRGHGTESWCSFCGGSAGEAGRLTDGPPGIRICDECIAMCMDLVAEGGGEGGAEEAAVAASSGDDGSSLTCGVCSLSMARADVVGVLGRGVICRLCADTIRALPGRQLSSTPWLPLPLQLQKALWVPHVPRSRIENFIVHELFVNLVVEEVITGGAAAAEVPFRDRDVQPSNDRHVETQGAQDERPGDCRSFCDTSSGDQQHEQVHKPIDGADTISDEDLDAGNALVAEEWDEDSVEEADEASMADDEGSLSICGVCSLPMQAPDVVQVLGRGVLCRLCAETIRALPDDL